jgi:hypothetical protein
MNVTNTDIAVAINSIYIMGGVLAIALILLLIYQKMPDRSSRHSKSSKK